MPGSAQWKVCTDEAVECFYCGQHILTLFLYTDRLSQLSEVKQPEVVKYYKDSVDLLTEVDPHFIPIKTGEIPHIIGPFTGWRYRPMHNIVEFCQTYDQKKPNFIEMGIE